MTASRMTVIKTKYSSRVLQQGRSLQYRIAVLHFLYTCRITGVFRYFRRRHDREASY